MYETTRLEWFIRTNEKEPLLAFNDGLVASKLISKIMAETHDDENVTSILSEFKDQIQQASLNAIIMSTKKSLGTLNINPYAEIEEERADQLDVRQGF